MKSSTTEYLLAASVVAAVLLYVGSTGGRRKIFAMLAEVIEQTPRRRYLLIAVVGAYLVPHAVQWRFVARSQGVIQACALVVLAAIPWLLTFAVFGTTEKTITETNSSPAAAPNDRRTVLLVAACAALLSAIWSYWRSNGYPLIIDEALYLFQANLFRAHELVRFLPAVAHPFVANEGVVASGGHVYTQYPPGWPALIALWPVASAPWLLGPVLLGVLVIATSYLVRCFDRSAGWMAACLIAANTFVLYWGATLLSDLPATTFTVVAATCIASAAMSDSRLRSALLGAAGGLAWGVVFAMRPLTAAAVLPVLGAVMLVVERRRPWKASLVEPTVAAALAAVPLVALVLAYNLATNGNPLLFGYAKANGHLHSLGYGTRGFVSYDALGKPLQRVSEFTFKLALAGAARQLALLDAVTVGGFLTPIAFVTISRVLVSKRAAVLLLGSMALPVAHLAWFFTDSRYYLPLVPLMTLCAAVCIQRLRPRLRSGGALPGALLIACSLVFPITAMNLDGFWTNVVARDRKTVQIHAAIDGLRERNDSTLLFVLERGNTDPLLFRLFPIDGENRYSHKLLVLRDLGTVNTSLVRQMPGWSFACVDDSRPTGVPRMISGWLTCRDFVADEVSVRR